VKITENAKKSVRESGIAVLVSFVVYFVILVVFGLLVSRFSTPDYLTLLPNQIPQFFAIVFVLLCLNKLLDMELLRYGLNLNRRWVADLVAGVVVGFIFQAISTVALVFVGDGSVTDSWTYGIFDSSVMVVLALFTTCVAFFIVAVGEDLMFRGILIREFTESLVSLDISRRVSTLVSVVASSVLFGVLHLGAGAEGLSTSVVVLQAVIGGLYFGVAYIFTGSLALPVGIHLSTNVWTTVVFGQPDSGYPMAYVFDRSVDLNPDILVTLFLPSVFLVLTVIIWVRLTRGEFASLSLGSVSKDE
jgi:hypothetical protein